MAFQTLGNHSLLNIQKVYGVHFNIAQAFFYLKV